MVSIVAQGNTYHDGSVPPGNMGNGGHRDNLLPMLRDVLITFGQTAQTTSVSSVLIGTGSKSFTLAQDVPIPVGAKVIAASAANTANYMWGTVTAKSGVSLTINVADASDTGGSGTFADWIISVSGIKGPASISVPVSVGNGGTGLSTLTDEALLVGNAGGAVQFIAPGADGTVLTSTGTAWQAEALPAGFPTGTRLVFHQTTAPTGWTKDATAALNNSALRLVTGTATSGGVDDFTTIFGASKETATYALTVADLPSHSHAAGTLATVTGGSHSHGFTTFPSGGTSSGVAVAGHTTSGGQPSSAVAVGGNDTHSGHTHAMSGSTGSAGSGTAHKHGLSLDLKYQDVIIGVKD